LSSSGLVHASNTMRGGALNIRVTTTSRSDLRSTDVPLFIGMGSRSFLSIALSFLKLKSLADSGAWRDVA
jgi:hypothetical protein